MAHAPICKRVASSRAAHTRSRPQAEQVSDSLGKLPQKHRWSVKRFRSSAAQRRRGQNARRSQSKPEHVRWHRICLVASAQVRAGFMAKIEGYSPHASQNSNCVSFPLRRSGHRRSFRPRQGSVQIHGRLDTSFEHQKVGANSLTRLFNNHSRFGFVGSEDLGGILRAAFSSNPALRPRHRCRHRQRRRTGLSAPERSHPLGLPGQAAPGPD